MAEYLIEVTFSPMRDDGRAVMRALSDEMGDVYIDGSPLAMIVVITMESPSKRAAYTRLNEVFNKHGLRPRMGRINVVGRMGVRPLRKWNAVLTR